MISQTPRKCYEELGLEISYRRAKKVWDAVTRKIQEEVLSGGEVKLPGRMGTLSIRGKKTPFFPDGAHRYRNINWKETNKLWEECPECKENKQFVFYLNEHSDRVYYKWFWSKHKMYVSNRHLYRFVPAHTLKKRLSSLIFAGKEYLNNVDERPNKHT